MEGAGVEAAMGHRRTEGEVGEEEVAMEHRRRAILPPLHRMEPHRPLTEPRRVGTILPPEDTTPHLVGTAAAAVGAAAMEEAAVGAAATGAAVAAATGAAWATTTAAARGSTSR